LEVPTGRALDTRIEEELEINQIIGRGFEELAAESLDKPTDAENDGGAFNFEGNDMSLRIFGKKYRYKK
jgi:hypothetical protein